MNRLFKYFINNYNQTLKKNKKFLELKKQDNKKMITK